MVAPMLKKKKASGPYTDTLSAVSLGARLDVSPRTVRRWKQGAGIPPRYRAVLDMQDGQCGALDPAWQGWRFKNGYLISDNGMQISLGEILAMPITLQLVRALQREL